MAQALVLSAPRVPPGPPAGGGACSLRSTRSVPRDDWGVGSFSDLGDLRRWVEGLGGSVTATLPLFAQFLDESMLEPSPYSPASRLFWNETYIDVTRAPGLGHPMQRVRRWTIRPSANGSRGCARPTSRIIRPWRRRSGRSSTPSPSRRSQGRLAGLAEFARNPRAADYARFRAEVERRGSWWERLARRRAGRLFRATRSRTIARYHLYVQWVATQQLAEAADGTGAAGGGLMLDLRSA